MTPAEYRKIIYVLLTAFLIVIGMGFVSLYENNQLRKDIEACIASKQVLPQPAPVEVKK